MKRRATRDATRAFYVWRYVGHGATMRRRHCVKPPFASADAGAGAYRIRAQTWLYIGRITAAADMLAHREAIDNATPYEERMVIHGR